MDAFELLDAVENEETFLVFVRALEANRLESMKLETASPSSPYVPDAGGWENTTIESFLEAAIAWAEASSKSGSSQRIENPWKWFAHFLYCGKIYE